MSNYRITILNNSTFDGTVTVHQGPTTYYLNRNSSIDLFKGNHTSLILKFPNGNVTSIPINNLKSETKFMINTDMFGKPVITSQSTPVINPITTPVVNSFYTPYGNCPGCYKR